MRENILDERIISAIRSNKITEQKDLQEVLRRTELCVPQATLSRRLKKLNIKKIDGVYKMIEYNQRYLPVILNMQISDFGLIVLQTHPGQANSLAYFIDRKYVSFSPNNQQNQKDSNIIGTIAGDDTVLMVLKSKDGTQKTLNLLRTDFPYLI